MKKSAHLINTSRGGLVDEADLAETLNTESIAGTAVYVVSVEPDFTGQSSVVGKKIFS